MSGDGRELNDRKKMTLKAIIEAHVKEGEPVGSKYLTQHQQILAENMKQVWDNQEKED